MSEINIRTTTTPPATIQVEADASVSIKEAIAAAEAAEADRIQTGLDRIATGDDAIATAADRAQTGLDAAATAADRVQTGEDVAESTAVLASSLKIANNLSDVTSAPAALVNLGVTRSATDLNSMKLIGEPFALWDHITGCPVPSNAGTAKFIKLTAGLMGVGAYNEGLLGSESVTGSAPLVEATATILVGPMTGQTVHLINTEEAFLRARTTSGALQQDQMQQITGRFGIRRSDAGGLSETTFNTDGAISNGATGTNSVARLDTTGTNSNTRLVEFDSANSPDARTSSTTSGETRSKNVSATFYLRIA